MTDVPAGEKSRFSRVARIALNALFVGGFAYVVLAKADYSSLAGIDFASPYLWAAIVLLVLWQGSGAWRWKYCLNRVASVEGLARRAGFSDALRLCLLGNLASISFLPSTLGQDAVRLAKWRDVGETFQQVAVSVVVTRISGVLAVLSVGIAALPLLINIEGLKLSLAVPDWKFIAIGAFAVLSAGLFLAKAAGRIAALREKLDRARRYIDFTILSAAFVSQAVFVAGTAFALAAVREIDFASACTIIAASALGRLLPVSGAGLTLGEGLQTALLVALGWRVGEAGLAVAIGLAVFYVTSGLGLAMETAHRFRGGAGNPAVSPPVAQDREKS